MMVDNEFTILGKKLKVYAILTLVAGLLSFVDSMISGFLSIPLLVFQVMVIVAAKKSAAAYKKAELNTFATLMIVSMILSFASVGVIFAMTFGAVFSVLMDGGSVISILPTMIAGQVITLITMVFEAIAWIFMLGFFNHLEEIDVRTRGKPGAILAVVGSFISIASSLIVGIPSILMNPTIDLDTLAVIMTPGQVITSALFSLGTLVVSVIGYFIMCNAFVQLGNLRPPSPAYSPASAATSWVGRDTFGSPPPGAWDGRATPVDRAPGTPASTDPGKCPACGSSLVSTDPRALFCGECGARLPGRG
jgi:hypothetical protein